MKKHKRIPTLIGLIILLLGAAIGVYLVTNTSILRPQASPQTAPQDIRVSNITENSFTVSWTTGSETLGAVNWGTSPDLGQTQTDGSVDLKQAHYVTVNNLLPQTNYYYNINSGGVSFDNADIPWEVTTLPASNGTSTEVISGVIVDSASAPVSDVIVYINADGVNTLSAKTSASGSYLIPLGSTLLSPDDLLQIFAQGGIQGNSSGQIFYKSANPIPQMVLGQTHDFRNLEAVNQAGLPKSAIDVPNALNEPGSKIVIEEPFEVTPTVTLETISQDQVITNSTPEFSGRAPAGQAIIITVQSDPITEEIQASENGEWAWTPPQELEPGEHSVTVQWTDDDGILQQITRSFEVSAQEPVNQTLSTPAPVPTSIQSSGLTLTIILSIIGIGLIFVGLFWNIRINKK